ncbi:MAG: sensor histidine kinase [Nitrolancea sp.]
MVSTEQETSRFSQIRHAVFRNSANKYWIDTSEESHRRQARAGRVAGLAWLFFLGYPLADLLRGDYSTIKVVLGLLGMTAFVATYIYGFFNTFFEIDVTPKGWGVVLLLGAITTSLTLGINGSWLSAMIFVVTAAGCTFPERTGFRAIGVISGATIAMGIAIGAPITAITSIVFEFVLVGMALIFLRRLIQMNAQLRTAREENARLAVSEERLRFARDLHDLLGHSLSLIALKSELAGRLVEVDPARSQREITDIEQVTRAALREVRDAVSGYRQPMLEAELTGAKTALDAAGIECHVSKNVCQFPATVESTLGWAVREGVTNVIRHSGARSCSIRIDQVEQDVILTISDDGRGVEHSEPSRTGRSGFGLAGLKERLSSQQGTLEAGPGAEGGFRVVVTLPPTPTCSSTSKPEAVHPLPQPHVARATS